MEAHAHTVLVHGLWLHGLSMLYLERRIAASGYRPRAYSYPSVRKSLAENAERLARFCAGVPRGTLNFVAHSMGGLVTLKAASMLPPERVGRIVLIGTPFADCHAGRCLKRLPAGGALLGRCMDEWLQSARETPLGACEVGVIAGTHRIGLGRFVAPDLPRPNDGVVSVEETRVPGMRDHIILPVSHTFMLVSRDVAHQACRFLKLGAFDRAREPGRSVN